MNLIVKDTHMPKCCAQCFAFELGSLTCLQFPRCRITGEYVRWIYDTDAERLPSCPLLPYSVYGDSDELVPGELPKLDQYEELESFIKHFED